MREPEELEAAAGDVAYEIDMLVTAAQYCGIGLASPAHDETKNLALEAFLLHYRNLRAFLCPGLQTRGQDDVFACHYLGIEAPVDVGTCASFGCKEDREKLNKLLAHISYTRRSYQGNKFWPVREMCRTACAELIAFFKQLPGERVEWFRNGPERAKFGAENFREE